MGPRPAELKLDKDEHADAFRPPRSPFAIRDLPSPRTGEVPPALSPLDAFALQSRMLAKRFDDEASFGRRISRLPPVMVETHIANRHGFSRFANQKSPMDDLKEGREDTSLSAPTGITVEEAFGANRPVSHYPRHSNIMRPDFSRQSTARSTGKGGMGKSLAEEYSDLVQVHQSEPEEKIYYNPAEEFPKPIPAQDYFGNQVPRVSSPEPVDGAQGGVEATLPSPTVPSLTGSMDTLGSNPRTMTTGSQKSQRSLMSDRGLAVPLSPRYPRSPRSFQSIRSVPPDSGDEDAVPAPESDRFANRALSNSSNTSRPRSPFSPWMRGSNRSPSMTSEYSVSGAQAPAKHLIANNFSRPMSSAEPRPSMDSQPSESASRRHIANPSVSTQDTSTRSVPSRQTSQDDQATPFATGQQTASSNTADDYFTAPFASATGADTPSSYTYASFTLPRGRNAEPMSNPIRSSWMHRQFNWDKEEHKNDLTLDDSSIRLSNDLAPPRSLSPIRPSSAHALKPSTPITAPPTPNSLPMIKSNSPDTPKTDGSHRGESPQRTGSPWRGRDFSIRPSSRSRSADPKTFEKSAALHRSMVSLAQSESTDHTIKPTPLHQKSPSADLTPEEHLDIGIDAHSSGQTHKSTYHLRLAANAGLPTAMLLYALACRHGWGMRPNQAEGVSWLRKAVETSGLNVVDAEDRLDAAAARHSKALDPVMEVQERRKRKAQYALAIYELGISSMNGWGCVKDKPLAVRCYEIAGSWGDADALAEAGFCYAQGAGVKKDMKKAASLYRKAADMGMSMAGNSWIYKAKYMDDADSTASDNVVAGKGGEKEDKDKEVKPTGRSRGRSLFGKKRDNKTPAPALPL